MNVMDDFERKIRDRWNAAEEYITYIDSKIDELKQRYGDILITGKQDNTLLQITEKELLSKVWQYNDLLDGWMSVDLRETVERQKEYRQSIACSVVEEEPDYNWFVKTSDGIIYNLSIHPERVHAISRTQAIQDFERYKTHLKDEIAEYDRKYGSFYGKLQLRFLKRLKKTFPHLPVFISPPKFLVELHKTSLKRVGPKLEKIIKERYVDNGQFS